jgi:hypothetical protein
MPTRTCPLSVLVLADTAIRHYTPAMLSLLPIRRHAKARDHSAAGSVRATAQVPFWRAVQSEPQVVCHPAAWSALQSVWAHPVSAGSYSVHTAPV